MYASGISAHSRAGRLRRCCFRRFGRRWLRPPSQPYFEGKRRALAGVGHRQGARPSLSLRCLVTHRCPYLPACYFPYPGVASGVLSNWPLTHRPWPRPAWGKGGAPDLLRQLRVIMGCSASNTLEGRPLGVTPWPLARWQATSGRHAGRRGLHVSPHDADQDVEPG
jgi:hypothetical protein